MFLHRCAKVSPPCVMVIGLLCGCVLCELIMFSSLDRRHRHLTDYKLQLPWPCSVCFSLLRQLQFQVERQDKGGWNKLDVALTACWTECFMSCFVVCRNCLHENKTHHTVASMLSVPCAGCQVAPAPFFCQNRVVLPGIDSNCIFYNTNVRHCRGQRLHPLQSCVVWRVGGSPDGLPSPERECERAAVLPTRACRSMPGTVGVSRMALRPIWPITQAGPRRFQRVPAATWSAAVSIGVSGRLGKRGQSPAGSSETDISALRAATLPLTYSHTHTRSHHPVPCLAHSAAMAC